MANAVQASMCTLACIIYLDGTFKLLSEAVEVPLEGLCSSKSLKIFLLRRPSYGPKRENKLTIKTRYL